MNGGMVILWHWLPMVTGLEFLDGIVHGPLVRSPCRARSR
jgi:hypothetical protein